MTEDRNKFGAEIILIYLGSNEIPMPKGGGRMTRVSLNALDADAMRWNFNGRTTPILFTR